MRNKLIVSLVLVISLLVVSDERFEAETLNSFSYDKENNKLHVSKVYQTPVTSNSLVEYDLVDLYFVFDTSGSIRDEVIEGLPDFLNGFLVYSDDNTQYSVYTTGSLSNFTGSGKEVTSLVSLNEENISNTLDSVTSPSLPQVSLDSQIIEDAKSSSANGRIPIVFYIGDTASVNARNEAEVKALEDVGAYVYSGQIGSLNTCSYLSYTCVYHEKLEDQVGESIDYVNDLIASTVSNFTIHNIKAVDLFNPGFVVDQNSINVTSPELKPVVEITNNKISVEVEEAVVENPVNEQSFTLEYDVFVDSSYEFKNDVVYSLFENSYFEIDGIKTELNNVSKKYETNEVPVLLINEEQIILELGDSFDLFQGISAIDSEDGDITQNIKIINNDGFKGDGSDATGEYVITYNITDSDGNTVTMQRKILVQRNINSNVNGINNVVNVSFDTSIFNNSFENVNNFFDNQEFLNNSSEIALNQIDQIVDNLLQEQEDIINVDKEDIVKLIQNIIDNGLIKPMEQDIFFKNDDEKLNDTVKSIQITNDVNFLSDENVSNEINNKQKLIEEENEKKKEEKQKEKQKEKASFPSDAILSKIKVDGTGGGGISEVNLIKVKKKDDKIDNMKETNLEIGPDVTVYCQS